ncbi:MAG: hypothetical protein ACKO3N_01710 [Verrucomicrobiota bacterium]
MSRGLRLGLLTVGLGLGAGLAIVLQRSLPRAFTTQKVQLPDGTVLQLVSAQYGTRHMDPLAPLWEQLLGQLPPRLVQLTRLPLRSVRTPGATNPVLSCWLATPRPATGPIQPLFGLMVGDDHGDFAMADVASSWTRSTPDGRNIEGSFFPVFPRRARELRLRLYDQPWGDGKLLHEFRIPNPVVALAAPLPPPWPPAPPPVTASHGDLEATLQSLEVLPETTHRPPNDRVRRDGRVEFTLRQSGQPTTNWVAYHVVSLSDASGNQGDGNAWTHGWNDGRAYNQFSSGALPSGEPWDLEVEFCQRSGFRTEQLWEARVPLGTAEGKLDPMPRGTLAGQPVAVVEAKRPSWDRDNSRPTRVLEMVVEASGKPDARRWHLTIARAADSTGRDITANQWHGTDERRTFSFQVSTNATWVDLAITYVPGRPMTFRAEPTLRTNPAPAALARP